MQSPTTAFAPHFVLSLAAGLFLSAVTATPVHAYVHTHGHLKGSQPAEGANVPAPHDMRLLYSEPVDLQRSTITLTRAGGHAVALPALAADAAEPRAMLIHLAQPLAAGAYTVGGHAVAARNGHRTEGAYAFTIAAPGAAADAAAPPVPGAIAGSVRVDQPWARATAPQQRTGGAYMTLTSPVADRLVAVTSPVASRVEVHEMRMDGNVMRMREVPDGLPLPAGQAVALTPGGYHLMMMDLHQPLVAGQAVPVQLRFEHAPPQDVVLQVAPVGARGPGNAQARAHGGAAMGGHDGHAHE